MKLTRLGLCLTLLGACNASSLVAQSSDGSLPDLGKTLAERRAQSAARLDQETRDVFQDGTQQLKESGIEAEALQVGDAAPDFALPNASGETVRLSALLKQGPVVLTFYRGGWCPYCNLQLAAYQDSLDAIRAARGQLVAVSPESPDTSLSTKEKGDLAFEVLSDDDNQVARRFGIVFSLPEALKEKYLSFGIPIEDKAGAPGVYELPVPATYVIDTDGTIRWAFIDADYTRRAEPEAIVAALKSLR